MTHIQQRQNLSFTALIAVLLIAAMIEAGCTVAATPIAVVPVTSTSTATAAPSNTPTSTRLPTAIPTRTPTVTAMSTSSSTPTATSTATVTPTWTKPAPTRTRVASTNTPIPSAASFQPGTYPQDGRCTTEIFRGERTLTRNPDGTPNTVESGPQPVKLCIVSVTVRLDGNLQFNAQWQYEAKGARYARAFRPSDTGNKNVYVVDDLGNHYPIIELWGFPAREDARVTQGFATPSGWYVVPPARAGAQSFTFHIDDSGVPISGIVLAQP